MQIKTIYTKIREMEHSVKSNGTNSANMKYNNRQLILNIIRKQRVSRAELSRITGLTRAAVTLLIDEMIKEGLVLETGAAEANYGRKPVLLDLNPCNSYAVGIYISRDAYSIGIINLKGDLIVEKSISIPDTADSHECIKIISENVRRMMDESGLPEEKFLGIGVSAPGPVDIHSGVILNPPNFNVWHNVNIVEELQKKFKMTVLLENNSSSLALAEKSYGRGSEFNSFLLLVVDAGIGAGIIINETLYRGTGGFGSEAGHTSVDINGKSCSCGNRGCLELYASMPAAIAAIQKKKSGIKTWEALVDGALKGDSSCLEAIDAEARYLSAGIVNVINLLELQAVILTGDVNYKPEQLLEKIRGYVASQAICRDIHEVQIMNSSIMENSEVISAASIIIERLFEG